MTEIKATVKQQDGTTVVYTHIDLLTTNDINNYKIVQTEEQFLDSIENLKKENNIISITHNDRTNI